MSHLFAEYLESIRQSVRNELLPELQTPMTRHRAELIDMVLSRMIAEKAGLPVLLRAHWLVLAGRLKDSIPPLPPGHSATAILDELIELAMQAPADDKQVGDWDEKLASGMEEVLHLFANSGAEDAERRDLLIEILASAEDGYRGLHEDQVASLLAQSPVTADDSEPAVTNESLSAYLVQYFPHDEDVRAENVVNIPGGRSKATIMFDMISGKEPDQQLVMRKDFPVNFLDTRVVYEYPLLDTLARLNSPVARPLWLEDDTDHFGTAFMISEKVAGKTAGTLFTVAEASEAAGLELARVLAFFHSLDLDETGLAGQLQFGESDQAVQDLVEFWYQRWKAINSAPSVILESAFTWLRDHHDDAASTRHLVHGDAGIHNMMIDGDHVTALVDWEFAHAGDAAEDLAYCSTYVRQFMDWERFLDCYRDAGGPVVTAKQMRYWGVWAAVRNAVGTSLAHGAFASGEDRDLRVMAIGMNTYPKLLRNIAAALKKGS